MKHPGGSRETNFVFWRLLWGEQKEPTPTRDGRTLYERYFWPFHTVSTPKLALPICSSRPRRRVRGSRAPAAPTCAVPALPPLAPRLQLPPPASARESGSGAPAPCSAASFTLNQQKNTACRQGSAPLCSARHHHACSLPHGATCSDTRCLSLHVPACKRRVTPRAVARSATDPARAGSGDRRARLLQDARLLHDASVRRLRSAGRPGRLSEQRRGRALLAESTSPNTRPAGSVPSLVAGGGSGALLLLLGVLSLKAWKSGKKGASAPYTAASAGALH
jgi:hypothetical protein